MSDQGAREKTRKGKMVVPTVGFTGSKTSLLATRVYDARHVIQGSDACFLLVSMLDNSVMYVFSPAELTLTSTDCVGNLAVTMNTFQESF